MNWQTASEPSVRSGSFVPQAGVLLDVASELDLVAHGVAAVIPGFGPEGQAFGELVSTEEIVQHIGPVSPEDASQPVPLSWVRDKLGIESVAVTHDTLAACREFWRSDAPMNVIEAFPCSQARANQTIYDMLSAAARRVTAPLAHAPVVPFTREGPRIIGHIHIASVLEPVIEEQLYRVRAATGMCEPSVATLVLQQGCAGLFAALQAANSILSAARVEYEYVLITAENNMLPAAHQRARALPPYNQNLKHWLFPAIFGEGVGAMVVGRDAQRLRGEGAAFASLSLPVTPVWRFDRLAFESVTDEWRVAMRRNPLGYHELLIRPSDVRRTYRQGVTRHAQLALDYIGDQAEIHRLCLHESNPLLVQEAAATLGVPPGLVPTISARAGTLGCVSVFSTLEAAFADFVQDADGRVPSRIACSLIGEAGDHVVAGHLCLSRVALAAPSGRPS